MKRRVFISGLQSAVAMQAYEPIAYRVEADETVVCQSCGLLNHDDAVYCDQCGVKLDAPGGAAYEAEADETVECPACRSQNEPDSHFCDQCGFKLTGMAMPAEQSSSAARRRPDRSRATFALQAQPTADGGPGMIDGVAVTFGGNPNLAGRVFVPGSLDETLRQYAQSGRLLPMGYQHDPFESLQVIGAWTQMVADERGLTVRGRISDTQLGRDAAVLVKDGAIAGISIGFAVTDANGVRFAGPNERVTFQTPYGERSYQNADYCAYILKAELMEASLVSAPADQDAWITDIQSVQAAQRALPALQSAGEPSWDDLAYSMATLMGGRGAGQFADLSTADRYAMYQQLAAKYAVQGKTPPEFDARPVFQQVTFHHDEKRLFADRYLRKTLLTVEAGAAGLQGALSPETRELALRVTARLGEMAAVQSQIEVTRAIAARVASLTSPKE